MFLLYQISSRHDHNQLNILCSDRVKSWIHNVKIGFVCPSLSEGQTNGYVVTRPSKVERRSLQKRGEEVEDCSPMYETVPAFWNWETCCVFRAEQERPTGIRCRRYQSHWFPRHRIEESIRQRNCSWYSWRSCTVKVSLHFIIIANICIRRSCGTRCL